MLPTTDIPILQVCRLLPLKSENASITEELYLEMRARHLSDVELLQHLTAASGDYFSWIELDSQNLRHQANHEYFVMPLENDEWLVITPGSQPMFHEISPLGSQSTPLKKSQLHKRMKAAGINCDKESVKMRWLHFIPNQSPSTTKETPFQRLLTLLRLEKPDLRLIFLYSVVLGVLELGIPVTIQVLVNNVAFGIFTEPVFVLTLVLLVGLGIMAVIKTFRLIIIEMLQRRVFMQVAQEATQRIVKVNLKKHVGRLPELVNRFLDVVTVQKSASFLLLDGLTLLLQTIAGLTLLAFYHPFLLFFDMVLVASMLFVLFALGWGAVKSSIKESGEKYATVAWLEEIAEHNNLFKTSMGNQYAMHRTRSVVQRYLSARAKHFRVLLRQNIGAFSLQALASASLLGLGGWLVVNQELTIGQLVAAELIVAGVVSSFSKIGKHLESFYDLLAAMDKLGSIFDLPQEPQRLNLLPLNEGKGVHVEFENVSSPVGAVKIKDFNFQIQAGEKVSIVGPLTPSAKYFLDLIEGIQTPAKGWVRINGIPVHHLRLNDYRSQVVQLSKLDIIQDSILNNLRLSTPDLTRHEAQELLEKTGLWSVVQHFPDLLDTPLKSNGYPFSEPQAHRLMLARALAMKPRLLILDRILDATEWQEKGPISQWVSSNPHMTVILLTQIVSLAERFPKVLCFDRKSGHLVNFTEGDCN